MASKTAIANRALSKVGDARVSNIETEGTKASRTISDMWDIVRDALLTAFPWNFAIERASLAKDAAAPEWGYANKYQLPSDFLALLEIKGAPEYRLEGGFIKTDEGSPLKIRYIKRVTDTSQFDPLFTEAFASRLAYEACELLTQSNSKKQILYQEYTVNIKEAYASDSIQEEPLGLQPDTWLLSREASVIYDEIDYNL